MDSSETKTVYPDNYDLIGQSSIIENMGKNASNAFVNQYLTGDCGQMLKEVPDNSVNLIVTSPPYAAMSRE